MTLIGRLSLLEQSGLIRPIQIEPDVEYLFKHALVQDATYSSILRTDRKALHRLVGVTLEELYADRLGEFAAVLGHHFAEAGETEKAVRYLRQAGESAASQYALREAVMHFSRVLEIQPDAPIKCERGRAYGLLGEFDRAREDYEAALAEAHVNHDLLTESKALIELGALWTERDYQQAGHYYQQAQIKASQSGDLAMQAHTFNRLANWRLNIDQPQIAAGYHEQALAIFENLGDEYGIASTYDLLGMTNALSGKMWQAMECYKIAITKLRALKEYPLLASSLATIQLSAPTSQTDMIFSTSTPREAVAFGDEALQLAKSIHLASGESFALGGRAQVLSYCGEYSRAWDDCRAALEIAESIHHDQWITAAQVALGSWHASLLDFARAATEFEKALAVAKQIGSLHWQRSAGGLLASAWIELGRLDDAQKLLDDLVPEDNPIESLAQRIAWYARLDLLLARGDHVALISLIERMRSAALEENHENLIIIRLEMIRARAAIRFGEWDQAESVLRSLIPYLQYMDILPMLWQAHDLLSQVYSAANRMSEAAEQTKFAARIIMILLERIPAEHRNEFANRSRVREILNHR